MIEIFIVVVLLLAVIIWLFLTKSKEQQYKEGDYVVWFGGLYKVISVEDTNLVIKHIKCSEKYIVNSERNSIKKVSKKFAEKYLSLKPNYEGKLELLDK